MLAAMKYLGVLINLLLLVANSAAWYRIGWYYNAENPGKCTFNEQIILAPGETANYPGEKCAIITCMSKDGQLSAQGCGVYATPQNCKLGEPINVDAPYPKCCPRHVICNDVENT